MDKQTVSAEGLETIKLLCNQGIKLAQESKRVWAEEQNLQLSDFLARRAQGYLGAVNDLVSAFGELGNIHDLPEFASLRKLLR